MITEYHRPKTLAEALALLARPNTRPLGGGTTLVRSQDESCAVVDLQELGLNKIHKAGDKLEIGAASSLSLLLESAHIPPALAAALRLEAPLNLRNMGTVAGSLVTADGRSPFAAAMLALDARLVMEGPQPRTYTLGEFLSLRAGLPHGGLITSLEIPLNARLAFESVARTPADRPILCTALARWSSGRTRLVLGGWGSTPTLAMDGNEAGGIETAARNAAHDSGDIWASAEYRMDAAAVLARRCLEQTA